MALFIWVGTALGLIAGCFHARQIFLQRIEQGTGTLRALYYAAWTLALWSLFGAYLLAFWLLGAAGLMVSRLFRGERLST